MRSWSNLGYCCIEVRNQHQRRHLQSLVYGACISIGIPDQIVVLAGHLGHDCSCAVWKRWQELVRCLSTWNRVSPRASVACAGGIKPCSIG